MMKIWIEAARPKTLPLALSSIVLGSFLALAHGNFHAAVLIFSVLTASFLQILSNFANDYGDYTKGSDGEDRLGPRRAVSSGDLSPKAMKKAMVLMVVLSLMSGSLLIYFGNTETLFLKVFFYALGFAAIAAAIKYTVGKKPYGYRALGDVFVFIFFGLLGVLGTYALHTGEVSTELLIPA